MRARAIALGLAAAFTAGLSLSAQAGQNDFFGSNIGNSGENAQGAAAAINPPMSAPAGDYTGDEKRMQKKYKANLKDAEKLIAKAEKMIKSTDAKLSKKGKILKEIGEKRLAELKANNPFPELATSGKKFN